MHSMYQIPNFNEHLPVKPLTKVINFIGAPGSGKSTHAASLFAYMKQRGINCELISEYAKHLVWRENMGLLSNQVYVFAKQYEQQERLRGKVDYIITDSPLLLNYYYNQQNAKHKRGQVLNSLGSLVFETWDTFDNIMFYVERTKPYNPLGRNQTSDESDQIGKELIAFLDNSSYPYTKINSNTDTGYVFARVLNLDSNVQ